MAGGHAAHRYSSVSFSLLVLRTSARPHLLLEVIDDVSGVLGSDVVLGVHHFQLVESCFCLIPCESSDTVAAVPEDMEVQLPECRGVLSDEGQQSIVPEVAVHVHAGGVLDGLRREHVG